MTEEELINNISYLVNKYAPNEKKLIEIIKTKPDAAKGVLMDLSIAKIRDYDECDKEILKQIAYYYI